MSNLLTLEKKLQLLTPEWVALLDWRNEWLLDAHDYQLPPDWNNKAIWMMLAGRGAVPPF